VRSLLRKKFYTLCSLKPACITPAIVAKEAVCWWGEEGGGEINSLASRSHPSVADVAKVALGVDSAKRKLPSVAALPVGIEPQGEEGGIQQALCQHGEEGLRQVLGGLVGESQTLR